MNLEPDYCKRTQGKVQKLLDSATSMPEPWLRKNCISEAPLG